MMKRLFRGMLLGLLATATGLAIQCGSDPGLWMDGGLADAMRDGIGPTADAAGGTATRKVYTGVADSGGQVTVCDKAWKEGDPPLV